ncbi:MAG: substrate-binding domain-containing protein [Ruminococcus sp.]
MVRKKRKIFAVVTATAADPEQREVISGVIAQAQKQGIDIVVISNIYNPIESCRELICENDIYDLINSSEYDGFIIITESIVNKEVQKKIRQYISRSDVPVIAVGAVLDGLDLPDFHYINTDDVQDFYDITSHLIKHHHCRNIEMLSGYDSLPVSHYRAEGFRKALEDNGIQFRDSMVHFGNFWTNSGEKLAEQYIKGEMPMPEAVVCGNDYMAFGMLDVFIRAGIRVPEEIAVTGYESVQERHFHSPMLTTFRRSRRALGEAAVRMLADKLEKGNYGSFSPPAGSLVNGASCGCDTELSELSQELEQLRMKKDYEFVNLYNQLDHRLAECRTLPEFTEVCNEFRYQVRNAAEICFCLYENWHSGKNSSDMMKCYPVTSGGEAFLMNKYEISSVFSGYAAAYYFSPLFFPTAPSAMLY